MWWGNKSVIIFTAGRLYASCKCYVYFKMKRGHTCSPNAGTYVWKYTSKQAMTGIQKMIMTSKFPGWKPNYLPRTKCSLQAVNSHKHSSNLSTSLRMILCSLGSFQSWRRRCLVRLADKTFFYHIQADPSAALVASSPTISHTVCQEMAATGLSFVAFSVIKSCLCWTVFKTQTIGGFLRYSDNILKQKQQQQITLL